MPRLERFTKGHRVQELELVETKQMFGEPAAKEHVLQVRAHLLEFRDRHVEHSAKGQALQPTRERNIIDAFVEVKAKGQALQVSRKRHIVKRHVEFLAKGQAQQATRQLKLNALVEGRDEGQALQIAIRQLRQASQSCFGCEVAQQSAQVHERIHNPNNVSIT